MHFYYQNQRGMGNTVHFVERLSTILQHKMHWGQYKIVEVSYYTSDVCIVPKLRFS